MDEQISFFYSPVSYPKTFQDVDRLYKEYIFEGEKDDDVFTSNERKDGSRSYFFYGVKVFSFRPDQGKGSILKVVNDNKEVKVSDNELMETLSHLKKLKRMIFRNTITETFACCNDFKRCSETGACLYPDDRFFNGCLYRKNLEAGRNFFREG